MHPSQMGSFGITPLAEWGSCAGRRSGLLPAALHSGTEEPVRFLRRPGEQSLDGFWLRSQVSFHKGAGIKYYEPGSEKETQYRFDDSEGVDVWTPGR